MKRKYCSMSALAVSAWITTAACLTTLTEIRAGAATWPVFKLQAEQTWLLTPPNGERFDASGLLLVGPQELFTVSDRRQTLYRIHLPVQTNLATLTAVNDCFTDSQLAPYASKKIGRYDAEGLARDEQGRIYLCEEANRWILRCDPKRNTTELLPIDWSPVREYFTDFDDNASFEGVAIGKGKLYVANERQSPVIIVVDLASLKVTGHFTVVPKTTSLLGMDYSDLAWHEGSLFVLCRQHRVVLEVNPETRTVVAEFSYRSLEDGLSYYKNLPVGIMEGLAVDQDFFWLATDNNGLGREQAPQDPRPTLLKCPRPKKK